MWSNLHFIVEWSTKHNQNIYGDILLRIVILILLNNFTLNISLLIFFTNFSIIIHTVFKGEMKLETMALCNMLHAYTFTAYYSVLDTSKRKGDLNPKSSLRGVEPPLFSQSIRESVIKLFLPAVHNLCPIIDLLSFFFWDVK